MHVWEVPLDARRLMIPERSADDAPHLHSDGCRLEKLRLIFQSQGGSLRVSVIRVGQLRWLADNRKHFHRDGRSIWTCELEFFSNKALRHVVVNCCARQGAAEPAKSTFM